MYNLFNERTEEMSKGITEKKNSRDKEPVIMLIAKSAMIILFLWSGFFWSGVTIINFYMYNTEYSYLATQFLIGSSFLLVSLILCLLRKYILQFVFCVMGLIPYLMGAGEMMGVAETTGVVFNPSFELRHLPILVFVFISLLFAMMKIWQNTTKKIERRNEFDNSPTKSILDD